MPKPGFDSHLDSLPPALDSLYMYQLRLSLKQALSQLSHHRAASLEARLSASQVSGENLRLKEQVKRYRKMAIDGTAQAHRQLDS